MLNTSLLNELIHIFQLKFNRPCPKYSLAGLIANVSVEGPRALRVLSFGGRQASDEDPGRHVQRALT